MKSYLYLRHFFLKCILLNLLLVNAGQLYSQQNTGTYDEDTTTPDGPDKFDDYTSSSSKYFYEKTDSLQVTERNLPAPVLKKWQEDEEFWYANEEIKRTKEKRQPTNGEGNGNEKYAQQEEQKTKKTYQPLTAKPWFQAILWIIIIGGFATVLVMYLSNSSVGLFRKKIKKNITEEEDEVSTENIFEINYQKEIDRAAAQGNFRLAIRLMYLRLLKSMAEKNIIRYQQDKTNLDYLGEIHQSSYYPSFFRLTRNYEYSWYGLFPVSEEAYAIIRKDFSQMQNELIK